MLKTLRITATITLLSLIVLCLLWEIKLAPLHTGGSWIVLKALPLLLPLHGLLHGKRYTFQWMSLAIWPYFVEGTVRAMSDLNPVSRHLALAETILALVLFVVCAAYAYLSAPSKSSK